MTATGTGAPVRINWIDAFRGLAILLMVPANLAPYYGGPVPLWFQLTSSLAAPMFVCISAGMVMLRGKERPLGYYVTRGACVIFVGASIDLAVWNQLPFMGFDVLYLIGLAMPVAFLFRRVRTRWLLAAALVIVAVAPVLRLAVEYNRTPNSIALAAVTFPEASRVLASWLVDGWFPVFPWLGIALLGAAFFRFAFVAATDLFPWRIFVPGLLLAITGVAMIALGGPTIRGVLEPVVLAPRDGYIELFYPAVTAYVVAAIGVVVLSSAALMSLRDNPSTRLLAFFGKYSMLTYIAHQALGKALVGPLLAQEDGSQSSSVAAFVFANLAVFLTVYLVCVMVERLKRLRAPRHVLLQVVFGR